MNNSVFRHESWDTNNWRGRSRHQVESTQFSAAFLLVAGALVAMGFLFFKGVKYLLF